MAKKPEEKSELTPEELEIAKAVHEKVVGWLATRYLLAFIIMAILSPLIGLIAGAVIESKLFTASRDALLAETKAAVDTEVARATSAADDAEARIKDTSDKAREYLDEIRSTREALDFVLRGTQTGELSLLQKRSTEVEDAVHEFEEELAEWEKKLKSDIPQGLDQLHASAESLRKLRDAVERLDALFKKDETAGALAAAFYRVDEFLAEFELSLFVPQNVRQKDLQSIQAAASAIESRIAFYRSAKQGDEQQILEWDNLKPVIEVEPLDSAPPQIGKSGTPSSSVLTFRWTLPNNPSWWNISVSGPESIKRVDLQHCSLFDTVEIDLGFPVEHAGAQKVLSQCTLSKSGAPLGAPCPRHMRLTAHVNRVEIALRHANSGDTTIDEPFYGTMSDTAPVAGSAAVPAVDGKPAEPEVKARLGAIGFVFKDTSLFGQASREYIARLDSPKPKMPKESVGTASK